MAHAKKKSGNNLTESGVKSIGRTCENVGIRVIRRERKRPPKHSGGKRAGSKKKKQKGGGIIRLAIGRDRKQGIESVR